MLRIAVLLVLFLGSSARADVVHEEIAASQLDARAAVVRSPHLTGYDASAKSRHLLVVYLPGTGGTANEELPIVDVLARDGYHVVSLDYPNSVTAATFRPSRDRLAFDHYREAVVYGGKVNDSLTVAPESGIEARLTQLVRHMAATHADWAEFFVDGNVVWDKLVLAGHSQGAGHAAYLAHRHAVHRVLILGGPQDYLTELHMPAPWLREPSRTPLYRFRVLLHRNDEYNCKLQLAANRALLHGARALSFRERVPREPAQILVSERTLAADELEQQQRDSKRPVAHIAIVREPYGEVWKRLLD